MKGKQQTAFIAIGVGLLLVGIFGGPRSFLAVGATLLAIGLVLFARRRRASGPK